MALIRTSPSSINSSSSLLPWASSLHILRHSDSSAKISASNASILRCFIWWIWARLIAEAKAWSHSKKSDSGGGGGGFVWGGDRDMKRVCASTCSWFRGARSIEDIEDSSTPVDGVVEERSPGLPNCDMVARRCKWHFPQSKALRFS